MMTPHVVDSVGLLQKLALVGGSLRAEGMLRLLSSRLFSVNHYYLLGKNIAAPAGPSSGMQARSPLVRATPEDIAQIRRALPSLELEDRREVIARLFFYWNGYRNCYVARCGDDIAYLQWMMFPEENELIESNHRRKFYPLAPTQVVVENAFTFPRYRGMGYLTTGTEYLLDVARGKGYRSALCYIRKDRIASLNDFTKMGFRIIKLLDEYKICGRAWRSL
jgi:hypothetical protein